jgi:hypothetical protein
MLFSVPGAKSSPVFSATSRESSALRQSCLVSLFNSLIQRLQHPRVHGSDHIHRGVQFFFGHPRFPCVRKAAVNSRIAEPHHRDGQTDEHLFALGKTFDGMCVAIKSSKVGFLQSRRSLHVTKARHAAPSIKTETSALSTRNSALRYAGFMPVISA